MSVNISLVDTRYRFHETFLFQRGINFMKILIFIFTGTWGANHQKAMLQIEIFRDKNPCEYFTSTFK